jgi:hypothetical protein
MSNFVKESLRRVAALRKEVKSIVDLHENYNIALSKQWVAIVADKNNHISKIEGALVKTCKAPNIRNI